MRLLNILQAQRHVSRQKLWHDSTFYVDLAPGCEIRTIVALHLVCEQGRGSTREITHLTTEGQPNHPNRFRP